MHQHRRHPCLGALGAVALLAGNAAAEPATVTIELQVEPGARPDYLCLVAAAGSTKSDDPLSSVVLESLKDVARISSSDEWRFHGVNTSLLESQTKQRPSLYEALLALAEPERRGETCDRAFESKCEPRFTIPTALLQQLGKTPLHLNCTKSVRGIRPEPASRRVVVVNLAQHQGIEWSVASMRLDGTVATFQLSESVAPNKVLVASVIGGHYVPSRDQAAVDRRFVLPLEPRCSPHTIRLPDVGAPSSGEYAVTFEHQPDPPVECVAPAKNGAISLDLPYQEDGGHSSVDLEQGSGWDAAKFRASWTGRVAPEPLDARLVRLPFQWQRSCFYPKSRACPAVTLPGSGVTCEPATGARAPADALIGRCSYRCEVEGANLTIDLPTTVHFQAEQGGDAWEQPLGRIGQTIDGYVPAPDRTVELDFSAWRGLSNQNRDDIDGIDVLFPNGRSYRVINTADQNFGKDVMSLPIPASDLRCADQLFVKPFGERFHEGSVSRLGASGVVAVEDPRDRSFNWTYTIGLGGGVRTTVDKNAASTRFLEMLYGDLGLGIRYMPWIGAFFELPIHISLGSFRYEIQRADGASSFDTIPYQWVGFGLLGGAAARRVAIGYGLELSLGSPTNAANREIFGTSVAGGPTILNRIRLTRFWSLDLNIRFLFGHNAARMSTGAVEPLYPVLITSDIKLVYSLQKLFANL